MVAFLRVMPNRGIPLVWVLPVSGEFHPEPLDGRDVVRRDEESGQCPMRAMYLRHVVGRGGKILFANEAPERVGATRLAGREVLRVSRGCHLTVACNLALTCTVGWW